MGLKAWFLLLISLIVQSGTLFTENVELVAVDTHPMDAVDLAPYQDDTARIIRFYEAETGLWREFSYSHVDNRLIHFGLMPVNTSGREFILFTFISDDKNTGYDYWLTDYATGETEPYEMKCGERSKYPGSDQPWIYTFNPDTPPTDIALCELTTGRTLQLETLPSEYVPDMEVKPVLSANGQYLIFTAHSKELQYEGYGTVFVFTYDLRHDHLFETGHFQPSLEQWIIGIQEWVTETTILISARGGEWTYCSMYRAEVDTENSLEFVASNFRSCPYSIQDPLRVVGFNDISIYTCGMMTYDFATRKTTEVDQGTLCWSEYQSLTDSNIGYYRQVTADNRQAAIVRRDNQSGETTLLAEAEIEALKWVSPDERYAVVILDSDGYISAAPGSDPEFWKVSSPMLTLLDLKIGEIVYSTPTEWSGDIFYSTAYSTLTLLSEDLLLVQNVRQGAAGYEKIMGELVFSPMEYGDSFLVAYQDGEWVETLIGDVDRVVNSGQELLVWTDGRTNSNALHLYDIATGTTTPLMRASPNYRVKLEPVARDQSDDGIISLLVAPIIHSQVDRTRTIRYVIRAQ